MQRQERDLPKFPFEFGPYGTSTRVYDTFRQFCPVRRVSLPSGLEPWLVTTYADVCTVHNDPIFSRAEAVRAGATLVKTAGMELEPNVLQNTDAEQHSRLRRVFGIHYGQAQIPRWSHIILSEAHRTIDSLAGECIFDLRADLFEPIATRCAESLFGFPVATNKLQLELFFDRRMMAEARGFVLSILGETTKLSADSYIGNLEAARKNGQISEPELIMNLVVFATATFAAVRAAFLGGIFALLRDRSQWEACLAKKALLPQTVDEMLRCFPNGDGQFLRIAKHDCDLHSVRISRGDAILAPVSAANTDPAVFTNPRQFDVHRSNSNRHVAFGIGRHRCIGAILAGVWMRTVLGALLERLPNLRLAVDAKTVSFGSNPLIYLMERLPVRY
jgi:cytochrome P450